MSRLLRRIAELTSLSLVLAATAFAAGPQVQIQPQVRVVNKVDNTKLTVLVHTSPEVVASAVVHGRIAASTQFDRMQLVLKSSDEQEYALRSLLDEQQDKSSPNFHKWLTPETFGASFGVSSGDISTVRAWLQDAGFTVESVSAGARVITFSGNAGQVESAFHTEIHNITVNGEAHVSNTVDLSVPSALAPVIAGIASLNDFGVTNNAVNPHPLVKGTDGKFYPVVPGTNQPDYTSLSSGSHYISPADVATIYNATPLLNSGINGSGVTIGVIGQTSINIGNVETFRSMFKLPNNDPQIVNVGPPPAIISDDIESDLDVEWAGALATAANVKFYTAGVGGFYKVGVSVSALQAVDSNVADIITMSYGGCEKTNAAAGTAYWNSLWEQAAAQGQTVFVSTGDSSATGCVSSSAALATGANAVYGVNALGSSAYNVAVGGTEFNEGTTTGVTSYWGAGGTAPYGTALSYVPETVWSEGSFDIVQQSGGVAGGGGGVAMFTGRPAWQVGPGIGADPAGPTFTTTGAIPATQQHRLVPDVSLIAAGNHDGTIFCSEGVCKLDAAGNVAGIGVVGGTSVATPVMAGVQALINQKNGGRQGNANFYYYKLAAAQTTANCASTLPPAATCNFNDIVTGNNYSPLTATGSYTVSTGTLNGTLGTDYLGFAAGTGYDVATGLGTPNITNLANNWKSVTFTASKTTLTLSPTTTTHGTAVAATITVAPTSGTGTPTGDVSVRAVAQTPAGFDGNVYTLSGGTVSASLTALTGGTYNVFAHYSGDSVFGASDSAPISVTIAKEASTTFLTPGNATSGGSLTSQTTFAYGLSVYLETEVQGNSATAINGNHVLNTGVPTGAITYALTLGTTTLPTATANLDGYGTSYLEAGQSFSGYLLNANYPVLAVGAYSATASYPGDNSFNSSSATATFTVNKASVNPTLRAATAEITSGSPAIFNITVAASGAGALPTGTVTLTDTSTSTSLGTVTLVNGAAVLTTSAITTSGAHSVTAAYNGDANYNATTSTAASLTVGGTASTTSLAVTVGGVTTTSATVLNTVVMTATAPTAATGTMYFYDGAVNIGSATISGTTHLATLSLSTLPAGVHMLTATWAGNASAAASTSAGFQLNVLQNQPTLSFTSQQANNSASTVSMTATLTLVPAVTASSGVANPAPSAAVQFMDGTTVLGTGSLVFTANYHTYSAAFTTSAAFKPGVHTLSAKFLGDANYAAATSGTQTVNIGLTTTTLTSSTANVGTNIPFTLTAKVAAVVANSTAVTGTVKFMDGPVTLGTSTVTAGTATLTNVVITAAGTHSITAVYSGDTNYYTSTSSSAVSIVAVDQGFTLSANPASLTIARGSAGTTTITGTSFGNYSGTATFSCSGLAAGEYCNFSTTTMSFTGTNTAPTLTLTIVTIPPGTKAFGAGFLWIPAMLLGGLFIFRRKQFSVRGRQLLTLAILFCGVMAVSGCGNGNPGTALGTSTVLVTANSVGLAANNPNISPKLNISVTVQ
ncbi:MAG TPA: Ig-like domain repeat protein [Acidobacteriaceae bacterium]